MQLICHTQRIQLYLPIEHHSHNICITRSILHVYCRPQRATPCLYVTLDTCQCHRIHIYNTCISYNSIGTCIVIVTVPKVPGTTCKHRAMLVISCDIVCEECDRTTEIRNLNRFSQESHIQNYLATHSHKHPQVVYIVSHRDYTQ